MSNETKNDIQAVKGLTQLPNAPTTLNGSYSSA